MRLAEGQARIPGPADERAVIVLRRGPLDVALSLPLRTFAGEDSSFTRASGWGEQILGWANLKAVDGRLQHELGFAENEAPKLFARATNLDLIELD
jgi:hypothetical protein